jgi:hypothetical protein
MPKEEPPGPEDFVRLYRRAFSVYGSEALWNMRAAENPTPADALAITKALRTHGGLAGRRLAEEIEGLCRAPHFFANSDTFQDSERRRETGAEGGARPLANA